MKCFNFPQTVRAARRVKPWKTIEGISKRCRSLKVPREVFDEVNRILGILSVQFLFLEDE